MLRYWLAMELVERSLCCVRMLRLLWGSHLCRCHFHSTVRVGHHVDGRCLHEGGLCHDRKLHFRAGKGSRLLAP